MPRVISHDLQHFRLFGVHLRDALAKCSHSNIPWSTSPVSIIIALPEPSQRVSCCRFLPRSVSNTMLNRWLHEHVPFLHTTNLFFWTLITWRHAYLKNKCAWSAYWATSRPFWSNTTLPWQYTHSLSYIIISNTTRTGRIRLYNLWQSK